MRCRECETKLRFFQTLPPMEVYQFVPSKTLTDLNTRLDEAGSELHLELDFGDDGNAEDDDENPAAVMARIAPDLDLANVGQEFDPTDVDRQRPKKAHQVGRRAPYINGSAPLRTHWRHVCLARNQRPV